MGVIAVGERNKMLNALAGRGTYTANAGVFAKLHTGDPGVGGTSNAATETDRQEVTFGSDADAGAISNTAAVEWEDVAATETYTHVSLWTAATDGTWLANDDLPDPKDVDAGDTARLAIGSITLEASDPA